MRVKEISNVYVFLLLSIHFIKCSNLDREIVRHKMHSKIHIKTSKIGRTYVAHGALFKRESNHIRKEAQMQCENLEGIPFNRSRGSIFFSLQFFFDPSTKNNCRQRVSVGTSTCNCIYFLHFLKTGFICCVSNQKVLFVDIQGKKNGGHRITDHIVDSKISFLRWNHP